MFCDSMEIKNKNFILDFLAFNVNKYNFIKKEKTMKTYVFSK